MPLTSEAEQLAQKFHETYERLAPSFGYETRPESSVPWEEVPEQNKQLMIAVCAELLSLVQSRLVKENEELQSQLSSLLSAVEPIVMAYDHRREWVENIEKEEGNPPIEDMSLEIHLRVGDLRWLSEVLRKAKEE